MFKKKRFLSKLACGLLCLTLAMPGEALTTLAAELPEAALGEVQEELVSGYETGDAGNDVITDADPSEVEGETSSGNSKEDFSEEFNNDHSEAVTDEVSEEAIDDNLSEEAIEDDPSEAVTEEESSEEVTEDTVEESDEYKKDVNEAEAIDPASLPEIKGDYYRQYAVTLYAEKKLSFITESEEPADETAAPTGETSASASETTTTESSVKLSLDERTKKLVVSGAKEELMSGEFAIEKTFHFDGKPLSRFSFDASAAKGQRITLGFYLDEEAEPFATRELVKQRKKNTWEYQKEYSVDTLGLNLTGDHTLKIKVLASSDSKPSFCINWFEFVESSVPVIYFDINEADGTIGEMNSSPDHTAECYGSMSIKVPAGYTSVDTGKVLSGGDYNLEYIRGRGNSTWDTSKKPYKLKLEESSKLLGMGKNKHWVLLANYYDNSLLRNRITYWLGKQLGMDYTPSLEPVDVIMNGEYYGSYFLCEQIRVDKNRVNIKDLEKTPDETDEENITGGYLLSMYPYGDEPTKKTIKTKAGVEYLVESPEFDGYENEAQANYIKNYLQTVEDALYSDDFKTKEGVRYSDLMDLRSTALYYWIQEFSMNGDGYISGSTDLYKPEHDKLYWGPLWDFDYVAWGSTEYEDFYTEGWSQNGENSYSENWNARLFEDAEFCQEVFASWDLLKPLLKEATMAGGQLDKYAADMEITARYNFEKSGPSPLGWEEANIELTYEEEIARLKAWIDQRFDWVDRHVASIEPVETTITFKDSKGNVLETRTGMVGRKLGKLPEAPKKKGYTFTGWDFKYKETLDMILESYGYKTEEELRAELLQEGLSKEDIDDFINTYKKGVTVTEVASAYTRIIPDMVLSPGYINDKYIVRADKLYLDKKVYAGIYYKEDGGGIMCTPQYQVTPFYADDGAVTFTTDNENVVTFDEYNDPQVVGAGECTLIARTAGGVTATAKIKIFTEEEAEENDEIYYAPFWYIQDTAKVKKGSYYQLKLHTSSQYSVYGESPLLVTTDDSVVEVGSAGVIHALRPGTAYVICISDDVSVCKVTVPKPLGYVGTTVVRKGVKYKVTSNTSKKRTVTCMGPSKKTIKKAVIPATITINNKTYRVTKIQGAAFKNCKSLASVSIGKYVEIVGKSAFWGCKKLTKIRINASQPKIYSSSFKYLPKKAVYSVPKKAKKYFEIVLKGKKIVSHK